MAAESRKLGCIGLHPREATQARLLLNVLQDRFDSKWSLVESAESDVVLVDPDSPAGQGVLADPGARRRMIAVVDGDRQPPREVGAHLHRPFRSEALVHAINAITGRQAGSAVEADRAGGSWREALGPSLRRALSGEPGTDAIVIEGLGDSPLLVEGTRDRIRGPLEDLTHRQLLDGSDLTVRRVSGVDAQSIAADRSEAGAYAFLWERGLGLPSGAALFGDPARTPVQFVRWPRQSRVRLSRSDLRAIGMARRHPQTAERLAERVGVDPGRIVALCNAAWLTADLGTEEQGTASARPEAPSRGRQGPRPSASLIHRIRNRLGGA